jgi:hypothetical protein
MKISLKRFFVPQFWFWALELVKQQLKILPMSKAPPTPPTTPPIIAALLLLEDDVVSGFSIEGSVGVIVTIAVDTTTVTSVPVPMVDV